MQPVVVVEGEYSASLDGMTLGCDRLLEVKCPVKCRDSTLWKTVAAGTLPAHYQAQVQHQLMVTKAGLADVFVFDGTEGILLEVAPDASRWPQIHAAWERFARYLTESQAPPLTDRDTRIRDDPDWLRAAGSYLELRTAHDELGTKLEEAKSLLVGLTSHPREQGGRLSVTRLWKRGSIDYKRVPALAEIDLEIYRSATRQETRVTII